MDLREVLSRARVLPVLKIENPDHAVPLARALVAGGLPVLEVTLRTTSALESIERMVREVPAAIVGAGTVTRARDFAAIRDVGASFAVSPGFSAELAAAARDTEIPFLPGVSTPSEAMAARDLGFEILKLFPAGSAGLAFLRSLAGPLPELVFCPTGGIDQSSFREYLTLANVICVGGSWVAPPAVVEAGDWQRVTDLAREAAALRTETKDSNS